MNQKHTPTRVTRVHDDGSLSVLLPMRKQGEAVRGFETWEVSAADTRGHLGAPRAATREELLTFERATRLGAPNQTTTPAAESKGER